jgi:hypothetical protein
MKKVVRSRWCGSRHFTTSVSYGFYRHEGDVHGPWHLAEFYPSLLPERGYLVHQDFLHFSMTGFM